MSRKSRGTEWKIPEVRKKSGNCMKNTSRQGKVRELSEKYPKSLKSRGTERKIPQARGKSMNWVKQYLKSEKICWIEWKIPQIMELWGGGRGVTQVREHKRGGLRLKITRYTKTFFSVLLFPSQKIGTKTFGCRWVAALSEIWKMGRECRKVGNHWSRQHTHRTGIHVAALRLLSLG